MAAKKRRKSSKSQTYQIITNDKGKKFLIRVVHKGDRYGRNDVLTHKDEYGIGPMIEFYDQTYRDPDFGSRGQFVSRYYADTLATGRRGGISLHGGVPEWSVDAKAMRPVIALADKLTSKKTKHKSSR